MAELNNSKDQGSRRVGGLKQAPRIDLTAMVDLAFLLITFFMLTTSLSKPNAMDLAMPVEADPEPVSEIRTMTICLGKGDRLQWYQGTLEAPIVNPAITNYSSSGIRKAILERSKAAVKSTGNSKKGLIVLIKPSDKSNYKNLVDILDEMLISNVASYAIVDITSKELEMMKESSIY
ncbi:MAG TPA: biopolymer transporter ExbD [Pedobacter sp.]|jgi:biopolymer transport protein ExbD